MHDINELESRGIPALFVASVEFEEAAAAQAAALGISPTAVYVPHPIQDRTDAEMIELADASFVHIAQAMTAESE